MSNDVYNETYIRIVKKNEIPTCNIIGVNIAAINIKWLVDFLNSNIQNLCGDYMCVSNVHTTVTAYEDFEYLKIQNGGIMSIPDGGPLSSLGRRHGYENMERTPGPSLMNEIFKVSTERGYRHYFYGSTTETLGKLSEKLEKKYPGMEISGMYSPPFRELTDKEDDEIIKQINKTNSDFIWVGLGAPKQEAWMAMHQGKLHGLMIGVGAGFDYHAENIRRAPEWMQKYNLEWFFRLVQDPKRLFKRYLTTNLKFISYIWLRRK